MRVALLENNTVTEICEINRPIADFPQVNYVEAGAEVAVGFTYDGTVFTPYAEYQAEQDEIAATQYQRNRAEAYPSLTEQADMAYWDRQNGTTTLDDAISAVKDTYPKP
jgi:hypothetical protein